MALMRRAAAWCLWFSALFWWWMLLVGEWNHEEWLAAAAAAALGATVAEACRRRAELELRLPRELLGLPTALAMVLVDFALVCRELVRLRRPRGRFVHRGASFDARGLDPAGVSRCAVVTLLASYSPNAFVIDVDRTQNRVLVHDLVVNRKSEEPA